MDWQPGDNGLLVNNGIMPNTRSQDLHQGPTTQVSSYINRRTAVDFQCWVEPKDCLEPNQKFSTTLNKLFALKERVVTINFSFINNQPRAKYFIRAQLMFSNDEDLKNPVLRCSGHFHSDLDKEKQEHVLRCETGENVVYEKVDGRPSVRLGLEHTHFSKIPIKFKFVCPSSCKDGINRRPTHLQFTLEDKDRTSLGTCKLEVRISSAPLRDMEKEESGKIPLAGARPAKKRRFSAVSSITESIENLKAIHNAFKGGLTMKAEILGWVYRSQASRCEKDSEEEKALEEGIQSVKRLRSMATLQYNR